MARHSNTAPNEMSPNSDMAAERWLNTVPQSLKSDSQDAQRMIWCVSVSSGVAAATSKTLAEGPPSRSCKLRKTLMPFPSWRCKRSRNRKESARTVPEVPGDNQGHRRDRWSATPGADDSEGAGDSRCTPGAKIMDKRRLCLQRPVPTREQHPKEDDAEVSNNHADDAED